MDNAHVAQIVRSGEYVVLRDNKVVAGPFATAKEAIAARVKLEREAVEASCLNS